MSFVGINKEDEVFKNILRKIQCCLKPTGHEHIVKNSVMLKCGGRCCKDCAESFHLQNIDYCYYCNKSHQFIVADGEDNLFEDIILLNLKRLFQYTEQAFSSKLEEIKKMNMKETFENKMDKIKKEIKLEYERRNQELKQCYENLIYKLDRWKEDADLLSNENINQIRMAAASKNMPEALDTFYTYQTNILQLQVELEENLGKIPRMEFHPNVTDRFKDTIIGKLNESSKVQKKDSLVRPSPCRNNSPIFLETSSEEQVEEKYDPNNNNNDNDSNNNMLNTTLVKDVSHKELTDEVIVEYDNNESVEPFELPHITIPVENLLYFPDRFNHLICTLDITNNKVKAHGPFHGLKGPYAIAVDKNKHNLFVASCDTYDIFMLDIEQNFRFIRKFGKDVILEIDAIEFDHSNDRLYVTTPEYNVVTIFDTTDGVCLRQFEIETPSSIRISNEYLFIASYTEGEYQKTKIANKKASKMNDRYEYTLKKRIRGANCIFVLNKITCALVCKIEQPRWFNPRGLYIDVDLNIITTATSLDSNNVVQTESLYCFDINGNRLNKIMLKYDNIYDFQLVNINGQKKIVFIRGDEQEAPIVIYDFM